MILSTNEVKKVLFGAVKIDDTDGVITPDKCTEKQCAFWWEQKKETLGKGARTTTGVRLDFHTDSTFFGVTMVEGSKFSLLINGKQAEHWFSGETPETFRAELPAGENRITLIFPSHSRGRIKDVELSDGATLVPHKFDKKILFFGDSITQGWDSVWDVNSYAWRVAMEMNAECIINGIGGARFEPDSIDEIPFAPDIVTVAYGTNDFNYYQTLTDFRDDCFETLRRIKKLYPQSEIFVLGPIWRADKKPDRKLGSFEAVCETIEAAAKEWNLHFIDGDGLVPHETSLFADERLHPNDEGFAFYAENLLKELKKTIKQ